MDYLNSIAKFTIQYQKLFKRAPVIGKAIADKNGVHLEYTNYITSEKLKYIVWLVHNNSNILLSESDKNFNDAKKELAINGLKMFENMTPTTNKSKTISEPKTIHKSIIEEKIIKLIENDYQNITKITGYIPKHIILSVCLHPSIINNYSNLLEDMLHKYSFPFIEDYKRLELIGDKVLGLIVAKKITSSHTKSPQIYKFDNSKINPKYSYLVSNDHLKQVAEKLKFYEYLIYDIKTTNPKELKIYADQIEAIIGAIYLSSGIDKAEIFIEKYLDM